MMPEQKRVLMIAFHYPPAWGSGVQRTLSFSKYLAEFGWTPLVLSASALAHPQKGLDQLADIPDHVRVRRTFALDAARHLALAGRYIRATAVPDRWANWWLTGVPTGLQMIRQFQPQVIWSTYPIATGLRIASTLHHLTGLPWVTDFRDPMIIGAHPQDPWLRKSFEKIEKKCVHTCQRVVVTTPGIKHLLAERYPSLPLDHWAVVANGYDEETFSAMENVSATPSREPFTFLHSGALYPGDAERSPKPFFSAIVSLRERGIVGPESMQIVLRATGRDGEILAMVGAMALQDMVQVKPSLPYNEALREMVQADTLLLFQGVDFDHMIPAKLFEYLRVGRPILAMTGLAGDSARVLREADVRSVVPLGDEVAIAAQLEQMIAELRSGQPHLPDEKRARLHSRRERTKELAEILDHVI